MTNAARNLDRTSQEKSSFERRSGRRSRTLKAAKIVFNQRSSVVDCTVRNLSLTGARFEVATVIGIPDQFDLLMDTESRPSKVIWRSGAQLGVTFLG